MTCSRPFWELLADGQIFRWVRCPYIIDGLGEAGFGLFLVGLPFVALFNWSESYTMPLIWLAISVPTLGAAILPGVVIRQIAGLLTAALALLIIGLYIWLR